MYEAKRARGVFTSLTRRIVDFCSLPFSFHKRASRSQSGWTVSRNALQRAVVAAARGNGSDAHPPPVASLDSGGLRPAPRLAVFVWFCPEVPGVQVSGRGTAGRRAGGARVPLRPEVPPARSSCCPGRRTST